MNPMHYAEVSTTAPGKLARGGRHRVRRAVVPRLQQRRESAPMGLHSQGLRHLIRSASPHHRHLLRHRSLHSRQRPPQRQPRPSLVLCLPSFRMDAAKSTISPTARRHVTEYDWKQ